MATLEEISMIRDDNNNNEEDGMVMEEADDSDFYDGSDDDVPSWNDDDDDDDAFGLKDDPNADSAPPSTEELQSNFALDLFRENWINDIGEEAVSKLADQDVAQTVELIQKCENKRVHMNDLGSALSPYFVALPYEVWFLVFESLDVTSVVHLGLACPGGYAASWRYIEQVTEKRDLGHGEHMVVTASKIDKSTRILRIHGDKAATVSPRGPRAMPNVVLSTIPERVEHLIVHDVCVRFSTVNHALPRFAGVVCMDLRSSKRKAMRFSKHSFKCPRRLEECLYYFAGNERDMPRLRRIRGVLVLRSRKYNPDDTEAESKRKSAVTNTFIIKTHTWIVDRDKGTVFGDSNETHHIIDPVTGSLAPRDNDDDTGGLCYIDSDDEHVDCTDRWWF